MPLLRVHGGGGPLPERRLRRYVRLGEERTFEQDPKYAIRLLVDIAIKALSPAINDPTTAVQALYQVEDLLMRLGRRSLAAGRSRDVRGHLRLVFPVPSWEDFLVLAFDEIRFYGASSIQVMRRMRALLQDLMEHVPPERRSAVERYLERVDNGKSLPFWRDPPTLAYWILTAAVGSPPILRALLRHPLALADRRRVSGEERGLAHGTRFSQRLRRARRPSSTRPQ